MLFILLNYELKCLLIQIVVFSSRLKIYKPSSEELNYLSLLLSWVFIFLSKIIIYLVLTVSELFNIYREINAIFSIMKLDLHHR